MKIKISTKDLKEFFMSLAIITFTVSGWIMYFGSLTSENNKERAQLEADTKAIADSIKQPPVVIKETRNAYSVPDEFFDFVDRLVEESNKLIEDNRKLQDSLVYYSAFYRLATKNLDVQFEFSYKDTAGMRIYESCLIYPKLIESPETPDAAVKSTKDSISSK